MSDETLTAGPAPIGAHRPARRTLLLAAAAALAVLLLALAAVRFLSATPAGYPADTPAGVFQRYLVAYRAGDVPAAYEHFSVRVRTSLTLDELERAQADQWDPSGGDQRVLLDRVDQSGERATLHLRVQSQSGGRGLLDSGIYDWELRVRLVREGGAWRIDEPLAGLQAIYLPDKGIPPHPLDS